MELFKNIHKNLFVVYLKYEYLRCSRFEDIEEMLSALIGEQKKYAETADGRK